MLYKQQLISFVTTSRMIMQIGYKFGAVRMPEAASLRPMIQEHFEFISTTA